MFNYRIDILNPSVTRIYSRTHDGTVWVDEVYGGYKVYNGERMLGPIKEIILGLVGIYNNTPPDRREIMNGTRIVDYYKRKENK